MKVSDKPRDPERKCSRLPRRIRRTTNRVSPILSWEQLRHGNIDKGMDVAEIVSSLGSGYSYVSDNCSSFSGYLLTARQILRQDCFLCKPGFCNDDAHGFVTDAKNMLRIMDSLLEEI